MTLRAIAIFWAICAAAWLGLYALASSKAGAVIGFLVAWSAVMFLSAIVAPFGAGPGSSTADLARALTIIAVLVVVPPVIIAILALLKGYRGTLLACGLWLINAAGFTAFCSASIVSMAAAWK